MQLPVSLPAHDINVSAGNQVNDDWDYAAEASRHIGPQAVVFVSGWHANTATKQALGSVHVLFTTWNPLLFTQTYSTYSYLSQ